MAWEITRFPAQAEFPATNYPTHDKRNNRPILNFDDSTDETCYFTFLLPEDYAAGGLTVTVGFTHTVTSGNVDLDLAIERVGEEVLDTDSDSFATVNVTDNNNVPTTAGDVDILTVTFNSGVDMDSLAAGEHGRISVTFDSPGTATGDIEFHWLKIRET